MSIMVWSPAAVLRKFSNQSMPGIVKRPVTPARSFAFAHAVLMVVIGSRGIEVVCSAKWKQVPLRFDSAEPETYHSP